MNIQSMIFFIKFSICFVDRNLTRTNLFLQKKILEKKTLESCLFSLYNYITKVNIMYAKGIVQS